MTQTEIPDTAAVEPSPPAPAAVSGPLHGPQCLTQEQRVWLLSGLNANRVKKLDKGSRAAHYLEAFDVRAHLTRTFGFANWSEGIVEVEHMFSNPETRTRTKRGQEEEYTAWTVGYRATVRLTVCCPHGVPIASHSEVGADSSDAQPGLGDAHHNALTSAVAAALKRAAANLGDQFGLSLYNGGATSPVVGGTLVHPPAPPEDGEQQPPRPDAHITQLATEQDASREPRSVSVPYEGDDYATAQATEDAPPADDEGAPFGPEEIRAAAIEARDLDPDDRIRALSELTTVLTKLGREPATRAFLIGEMQQARQLRDRANRAAEHAAAQSA